jgi:hypothetical protein
MATRNTTRAIGLCLGSLLLWANISRPVEGQQPDIEDSINQVQTSVLHGVAQRKNTQFQIIHALQGTIIDVRCPFGIDMATITRVGPEWPKTILVHLHLKGLESFQASSGDVIIQWSVASTGNPSARVSLRTGKEESSVSKENPYFTELRIVGGNGKIPLKAGYFEVPLPSKLFEGNPREIKLRWIDFYRN